jgi:ribosomal protein S1
MCLQVKETALLPGYVASVSGDAVFVRFLAGVTGRAGITQLADGFVSAPRQHFTEGQSVRAQVLQVGPRRGVHTSHTTHHTPHNTHHTSHITHHTSHITGRCGWEAAH